MRRALTTAAALLALGAGACDKDTYTIVRSGDGGPAGDGKITQSEICVPSNNGIEICDNQDNDCNGKKDEGFNLLSSADHCGKCNNSCKKPGMLTKCELGVCKTTGCAPGFHDLNGYGKDGCEYACNPTGAEICDGKDNDCNGKVDETINTQNDVNNCGKCGSVCSYLNGVGKCEKGVCKLLKCSVGYVNLNKKEADGCEWPCLYSNGGIEACDGKDNDCNGVIDDPNGKVIDIKTDPAHCGGCNISCSVPNGNVSCVVGKCVFNACKSGFFDADKDAKNGCECKYAGAETCNGVDDDCNGTADDKMSKYPGVCGLATPPCKQGVLSCQNGIETCTGKLGPWPELCDGKDQDCDGKPDPTTCVTTGKKRERRLDEPNVSKLGNTNSAQLDIAGSGNYLLAVWQDRRKGRADIYANLSTNGGASWSAVDYAVATESKQKLEPKVAFGGKVGSSLRAYAAYTMFTGVGSSSSLSGPRYVYLRRSNSAGTSWSAPVQVTTGSTPGDALWLNLAVIPGTTAATDRVVLCWEEMIIVSPTNPENRVLCSISVNGGASFQSSSAVASASAKNAIVPDMAVDSKYVYVTWQQGTEIRVARAASTSSSLAFSAAQTLSFGAGRKPRIAADGVGRALVVWEDIQGKLIDIYASASTSWGSSWSAKATRVDNDAPLVNGDSTNPTIAFRPNGRIFVVWEDTNRGKRDVYLNYSDKHGHSWLGAAIKVNANTAGKASSLHPYIAVEPKGSRVYVAWEDYRNGLNKDIYFNFSLDNGKTWNVPDYRVDESSPAGGANARAPKIWVSTQRIGVVWIDNRSTYGSGHRTGSNADIYSSWVK